MNIMHLIHEHMEVGWSKLTFSYSQFSYEAERKVREDFLYAAVSKKGK